MEVEPHQRRLLHAHLVVVTHERAIRAGERKKGLQRRQGRELVQRHRLWRSFFLCCMIRRCRRLLFVLHARAVVLLGRRIVPPLSSVVRRAPACCVSCSMRLGGRALRRLGGRSSEVRRARLRGTTTTFAAMNVPRHLRPPGRRRPPTAAAALPLCCCCSPAVARKACSAAPSDAEERGERLWKLREREWLGEGSEVGRGAEGR